MSGKRGGLWGWGRAKIGLRSTQKTVAPPSHVVLTSGSNTNQIFDTLLSLEMAEQRHPVSDGKINETIVVSDYRVSVVALRLRILKGSLCSGR